MRRTNRTRLGPHVTEGTRLLWQACRDRNLSQVEVAKLAGVAADVLSRVFYGERSTGLDLAIKLETALEIAPSEWTRPPTVPFKIEEFARVA